MTHPTNGPGPASVTLGSFNLLNLALPGRSFYPNQDPYGSEEYARKVNWLGQQIRRLNVDVLAVQEVWDEAALREAVGKSGLRYSSVVAPGAESGAQGTPRVGLITRLPLLDLKSVVAFPTGCELAIPDLPLHQRFERPVLHAKVTLAHGQAADVMVVHMKSKRPKFLQDAQGEMLEDRDDSRIQARASLRSLCMRGAEAAALRVLVVDVLRNTRDPLFLMGDLNDSPHSVTSQLIADTHSIAFDRSAKDTALFLANHVQAGLTMRRDLAYSHIHQGWPEVLDQIWVSEEFVSGSRFQIGEVMRVEYFNDHLHEGRDRTHSDHGFVRAILKIPAPLT